MISIENYVAIYLEFDDLASVTNTLVLKSQSPSCHTESVRMAWYSELAFLECPRPTLDMDSEFIIAFFLEVMAHAWHLQRLGMACELEPGFVE